jgi:hypothetical protein
MGALRALAKCTLATMLVCSMQACDAPRVDTASNEVVDTTLPSDLPAVSVDAAVDPAAQDALSGVPADVPVTSIPDAGVPTTPSQTADADLSASAPPVGDAGSEPAESSTAPQPY